MYIYQECDKYLKYNETYDISKINEERDSFFDISSNLKESMNKQKTKVRK